MPKLVLDRGGTKKFCEIRRDAKFVYITYGATIGATTQKQTYKTEAAAIAARDKLVAEKRERGYVAVSSAKSKSKSRSSKPTSKPESKSTPTSTPKSKSKPVTKPRAAPSMTAVRHFVHDDDKFWEVVVEDKTLKTRHGKTGSAGQTKLEACASKADVIAAYDKAVAAKLEAGYVERGSGDAVADAEASGATLDARNPALERAIEIDPYDEAAYSVLADWLQDRGDPRGELIALQIAGKHKQANTLLAKHEAYFLGELAKHPVCYDGLSWKPAPKTVTWKYGFIHGARMSWNHYWVDANEFAGPLEDVLELVLSHPSGRFLTELALMYNGDPSDGDLQSLIDLLAKRAPKTLRKLVFGDDVDQISWYHVGDLSKLWKAIPNLVDLYVEAGTFTLGTIVAPSLKKAIFKTGGLTVAAGKSIASGKFPAIEHLEIYYGDDMYGAECSVKQVKPLLDRTDLPALRRLGLKNAMFANDICAALPGSKLLPQLTHLDLSMGIMTDEGLQHLLDHADAFAHLEQLDLGENYLSKAAVKSAKQLAKKVVVDSQKPDDDPEYRNVSIGE